MALDPASRDTSGEKRISERPAEMRATPGQIHAGSGEYAPRLTRGRQVDVERRQLRLAEPGKAAAGRYTDVWSRREGRWLCVAADVTRG